jgi:hypothetical protein
MLQKSVVTMNDNPQHSITPIAHPAQPTRWQTRNDPKTAQRIESPSE